MSDLTRRVLDAHAQNPGLEQDTPEKADAVYDLATAAPVLARQVEAVERLADRLDAEADDEAAQGDTWDAQCIRSEARRIRDALTDAEKEADQ